MQEFYERFYSAAAASRANADYCWRLYGRNLCQHGMAELSHLDHLADLTELGPGMHALDLGCGNGMIAEYLSDRTEVRITGIDNSPSAIEDARRRTKDKRRRLDFQVMDMAQLDFPPDTFDVLLAIDSLYFTALEPTLVQMAKILRPGGKMGIFYGRWLLPQSPMDAAGMESLQPDQTDLARVLNKLKLPYTCIDYTAQDLEHARRKEEIVQDLKEEFVAEGNLFLFENHLGEAKVAQMAHAKNSHARYLYIVTRPA